MTLPSSNGERGVIMIMFVILVGVLVLLALGWSIDVPISQSATVRAQLATDIGAKAGVDNFTNYQAAANLAYSHAREAIENRYSPTLSGYIFGLDRASSDYRIAIPKPAGSAGAGNFYWLSCTQGAGCTPQAGAISSDALYPRYQSALNSVFDLAPIDDFRNGVFVFGRFTPFSFFPVGPPTDVSVVSTATIKQGLLYVLIDPSFTIEDNFQSIFGDSACSTDPDMWPIATPRNPNLPAYGAWAWPNTGSAFRRRPASGLPRTNPAYDQCIQRFYASMCDSQPFFSFKRGVVGLIDRLSQTSAYDETTMVGLTGYGELGNGLVPIQPKFAVTPVGADCPGDVAQHWFQGGPTFPLGSLPAGAESNENRGLHSTKSTAFDGYVDSRDPDPSVNRTRNCTAPLQRSGTGMNKWELCFCRGLYTTEGADEYLMVEDESGSDESLLSHVGPNRRRRGIGGLNWCDDDSLGAVDLTVNLSSGRDNSNGDTVRNLVAGLAMRTENPRLQRIEADINGAQFWIRPVKGNLSIQTGWRDIAPSMQDAAAALSRAFQEYSADPVYNLQRPVDPRSRALILFAFGAWSQIVEDQALAALGAGATRFDAFQAMRGRLRTALIDVVCNRKIRLINAFLPMRYHDKQTLNELMGMVEQLEEIYRSQLQGTAPTVGSIPDFETTPSCLAGDLPPTNTFVYDFDAPRFQGNPAIHIRKLQAAAAFGQEMPGLISKLLMEYEFRI